MDCQSDAPTMYATFSKYKKVFYENGLRTISKIKLYMVPITRPFYLHRVLPLYLGILTIYLFFSLSHFSLLYV